MLARMLKRFITPLINKNLNPTRIVAVSFGMIILMGTLLLMLPFASRDGQSAGLINALFTSTSATCVTGLVLVDTWTHWTAFGQLIILAMIQMGGLGFMTVITLVSLSLNRKIGLSQRLMMASSLNMSNMDGVVRVVRHALFGTCLFEGAGAILLSVRFIPEFGVWKGLWFSLFHAISAFCNAGFDLMGTKRPFSSLTSYVHDPYVLLIVVFLIVVGGLGFFVWEDIFQARSWKKLSLYSRIVIVMTAALLTIGTVYYLTAEWGNAQTLGSLPTIEKLVNALFQSTTMRTAGFNTIPQNLLHDSSQALCILFMMIGGSGGSTAGGIKTGTVCVLLLAIGASLRGREEVTVSGRTIPQRRVINAMTMTGMIAIVFFISSIAISLIQGAPYLNSAFEVASAMGTVGLSMGLTPGLTVLSRLLLVSLMYLGRVGPLSFSVAFLTQRRSASKVRYPTADVMIG